MTEGRVVIIGAGMGGLSAAITLSARGVLVTVIEKAAEPGGKMRQIPYGAGIDAGPTVFTMRWVFEELFGRAGWDLESALSLQQATCLARHVWADGSAQKGGRFDLWADPEQAADAVGAFSGAAQVEGFQRFLKDAGRIHDTLRDSFMAASRPGPVELARRVGFHRMSEMLALRPFSTMWGALGDYFQDPRLRQLFGRYATYVGSSPYLAPATLMLIAHVECQGVWLVKGGMIALARAMRDCAAAHGAELRFGEAVEQIETTRGRATAVITEQGERIAARAVIANTDVSALGAGHLGAAVRRAALPVPPRERSLSAITWAGLAEVEGFPLTRHTVFFSDAYQAEFSAIFGESRVPDQPTVYICAQDRDDLGNRTGDGPERVLCLINAPAIGDRHAFSDDEISRAQMAMHRILEGRGLKLRLDAEACAVTTPTGFEALFPGSGGALYGRASHGWTASFQRGGAETRIPGLYLAGGSVHPGAGVPMATLSGRIAAEAVLALLGASR
jgi:1-hydroxycarotenoid 3,4-desaturase